MAFVASVPTSAWLAAKTNTLGLLCAAARACSAP